MNDQKENLKAEVDKNPLELAKLTWDEYRYRHDLCWNLIFRITYVTAFLSVIPYLNNNIIEQAYRLVLITPVIGIGVSAMGGYRLYRELRLLDKIRKLHRIFQNRIYNELYKDLYNKNLHNLKGDNFTPYVIAYMILLFVIASVNFGIMLYFFLNPPNKVFLSGLAVETMNYFAFY